MKINIIYFLLIIIIIPIYFTYASIHETTHQEQFRLYNCDSKITYNWLSMQTETIDCNLTDSEYLELRYLTAQLEEQYLYVFGFTAVTWLLIINIITKIYYSK